MSGLSPRAREVSEGKGIYGLFLTALVVLALFLCVPAVAVTAGLSSEDAQRSAVQVLGAATVLRITSGNDTITFEEEAVPLGELAEEPAPPETPKPPDETRLKSGPRIEIEKKKPSSIRFQIGDDYYDEGRDIVKFGEHIEIAEGEVIDGDVVAIGGSIDIRGKVTGDVVAVGGAVNVAATGVIEGDAVALGGSVNEEPGSKVVGDVVSMGGSFPSWMFQGAFPKFAARFAGVTMTLGKSLVVLLLAWLIVLIFTERVEVTAEKASAGLFASFGTGLLILILAPAAMVLLGITIVGIPVAILLPFAIGVVGIFGYTAVGLALGGRVIGTFLLGGSPVKATLIGVAIIEAIPLVAELISLPGGALCIIAIPIKIIGYAIIACAIALGLGAAVLSRMGRRRVLASASRAVPPAAPPPPGAAPAPPPPSSAPPAAPPPSSTGPSPPASSTPSA